MTTESGLENYVVEQPTRYRNIWSGEKVTVLDRRYSEHFRKDMVEYKRDEEIWVEDDRPSRRSVFIKPVYVFEQCYEEI